MKKNRFDLGKFQKDMLYLFGFGFLWIALLIYALPKQSTIMICAIIVLVFSIIKVPFYVNEFKSRGFILPSLPWEDKYLEDTSKANDKRDPGLQKLAALAILLIGVWLLVVPFVSKELFNESIKGLVFLIACLLIETGLIGIYYRREIYKKTNIVNRKSNAKNHHKT
ncbi:MAG: hypothetical protein UT66_C0050G0008 [candidate division CPR2 bacterium GW2011_GWC1_39_9]|nr:MAG: hypothetical protein UT66_C0050G0008 [candidate division CPR2 bacterium GW2011_GWC1_39_9]